MRHLAKVLFTALLTLSVLFGALGSAIAKPLNVDAILFDPVIDGGRYLILNDSQTLSQWRFHAGAYFDYAHEPLEIRNIATGTRTGVVDGLVMSHFQAALGFVDWFEAGFSIPVVMWERYLNPNVAAGAAAGAKETHSGLGDLRFEGKFKLLDNYRYPIGVAISPFITAPTGNRDYFLGNGKVTGGAKIAIEGNILNKVWLTMNWGYQYMPGQVQYYARNADAIIDDLLLFGLGAHGKINDVWALIAELYGETVAKSAFQSFRQTPIIAHGAVRMTPRFRGSLRGLGFTLGAGGGLTKGVGNPDIHVLAGINYRVPSIVALEEPGASEVNAAMEEKIIITQKIHFEFASAKIRSISYPILNDVVTLLQENPHITKIEVEGHTDWIGSDWYNNSLSRRRAQSVVNYLKQHGVDRNRLIPVGLGESQPIADNRTTEGRAKNRRTEFTVIATTY